MTQESEDARTRSLANRRAKEERQARDEPVLGPAVHPFEVMGRPLKDEPEGHVPSEGMRRRIAEAKNRKP